METLTDRVRSLSRHLSERDAVLSREESDSLVATQYEEQLAARGEILGDLRQWGLDELADHMTFVRRTAAPDWSSEHPQVRFTFLVEHPEFRPFCIRHNKSLDTDNELRRPANEAVEVLTRFDRWMGTAERGGESGLLESEFIHWLNDRVGTRSQKPGWWRVLNSDSGGR